MKVFVCMNDYGYNDMEIEAVCDSFEVVKMLEKREGSEFDEVHVCEIWTADDFK